LQLGEQPTAAVKAAAGAAAAAALDDEELLEHIVQEPYGTPVGSPVVGEITSPSRAMSFSSKLQHRKGLATAA